MDLETKKSLYDVLLAGREIIEFIEGLDFASFEHSPVTQAAVERKFEIIGEALNRIKRSDPATLARITDAQRIIAFRNVIAHGYDIVDVQMIWEAACDHLPLLMSETENLLEGQ
jgi:uncharacterized protein with HEPN domain